MRALWLCAFLAAASPGATWHVAVAGLGGEPDYQQRFDALAAEAHRLVSDTAGFQSVALTGTQATRTALRAAIEKAAEGGPAEPLVLLLIGHGTFDGSEYKFNLPGPDVTAAELAAWLDRHSGPQLVVLATSASGAALPALQRPQRAIITATRSGGEKLAVSFPRYWVEALRDPAADSDKDEAVTALEAFRYASAKVAAYYQSQRRLATEHALLEDTGAGQGVREPSPENGRGLLAAQLILVRFGARQQVLQSPEKQKLLARREELQQAIDQLKYQKAALPLDEYQKQLRTLLVDLARVEEEIEQ